MIKIGDKVKIKNHPGNITGKVIQMLPVNGMWGAVFDYRYLVEFDNKDLIPKEMEYEKDQLEVTEKYVSSFKIDCECGAEYTSYKFIHLHYCPLYKKER